jgi:hypothetical protein
MTMLGLTGGCIANTRWGSPWPGWREPPVLNIGIVGLPSAGKSPAVDVVFGPLRAAERALNQGFPDRHKAWRKENERAAAVHAEWQKEVKEAAKQGRPAPDLPADAMAPPEPKSPRLFMTDPTMEAAALLARDEPKGLVLVRDELAGWIGSLDKYGGQGADRAFWIEAYGGRRKVVDRVKFDGVPLGIEHLSIPILGGIQPDRLSSMILSGDDDGLAARFCLVWPDPVPLIRPRARPSPEALKQAFRALRRLEMAADDNGESGPMTVPFIDEAAELLHLFRLRNREREKGATGLFLSWLGKLPGVVLRSATILEHLWWAGEPQQQAPERIDTDALDAALCLAEEYLLPMAERVYGEAALPEAERDAAALARWIARQAPVPEKVNARALRRCRAMPACAAKRYDAALAELEAAGWVRPAAFEPGPGRRAKDWLVNPAVVLGRTH